MQYNLQQQQPGRLLRPGPHSKRIPEQQLSDGEGFQQKQTELVVQERLYSFAAKGEPLQKKLVIRKPLCIYSKVQLYEYPKQLDCTPEQLCPGGVQMPEGSTKNGLKAKPYRSWILPSCLEFEQTALTFKQSGFAQSKLEPREQVRKNLLSEVAQRLQCVYSRHNQSLKAKHDLTAYIRNIKNIAENDMLRGFQNPRLAQPRTQSPSSRPYLQFFSNFESGNLHSAFVEKSRSKPQSRKQEEQPIYYLLLQNDVNTHGYNQWFNFVAKAPEGPVPANNPPRARNQRYQSSPHSSLRGSKQDIIHSNLKLMAGKQSKQGEPEFAVTFLILNISKYVVWNKGMRVLTYQHGAGWEYATEFSYYRNKFHRYNGRNYMTIEFRYRFPISESARPRYVQFMLAHPYTYSRLLGLCKRVAHADSSTSVQVQQIGRSEGGNYIQAVRFTRQDIVNRKCVVLLARQHPSETVSSHVIQHTIARLAQSQQKLLLDWCVIPMANPDGVVHGNSRTNLKGYDINRCWTPNKNGSFLSVEVEAINKFIAQLKSRYAVEFVIDVHGHSKAYSSFSYFSETGETGQIFNYLLSRNCDFYSYYKSRFGISYKKRPTFRGQMYYRLGLKNSITLEVSLYGHMVQGANNGQGQRGGRFVPYGRKHFELLGESLLTAINVCAEGRQKGSIMKQVRQMERRRLELGGVSPVANEASDSDSDPEDQYLNQEQRQKAGIWAQLDEQPAELARPEPTAKTSQAQLMDAVPNQQPKEGDKQCAKCSIYSAPKEFLSRRLTMLGRKSAGLRSKRKPIYTNSNVQFMSFEKLMQIEKNYKKFSFDQSNQFLSRRAIEQIKQKDNFMQEVQSHRKPTPMRKTRELKSKEKSIKSQPAFIYVYPTASNIKVNLRSIRTSSQIAEYSLRTLLKDQAIQQKRAQKYPSYKSEARPKSFSCNRSRQAKNSKKPSPHKVSTNSIDLRMGQESFLTIGRCATQSQAQQAPF